MNCKLLPTVVMMLLIKVTLNIRLGNQNAVCVVLWGCQTASSVDN